MSLSSYFLVQVLIVYMKKCLHSDWLRAVQFSFKTVQKRVNSVQKEETNQVFWLVNDQRNSKMANQIFCFQIKRMPWMAQLMAQFFPDCVIRVCFFCILLISNHMIFLVQFGINWPQIALAPQACAILLVFEKFICALIFIPNCTWDHVITYTKNWQPKLMTILCYVGTSWFQEIKENQITSWEWLCEVLEDLVSYSQKGPLECQVLANT